MIYPTPPPVPQATSGRLGEGCAQSCTWAWKLLAIRIIYPNSCGCRRVPKASSLLPARSENVTLRCTLMLKPRVEAPDDLNPQETAEWVEALDDIVDQVGPDRASYLLEHLMERAANLGVRVPLRWNTPYINTIPVEEQVAYPGDRAIEW